MKKTLLILATVLLTGSFADASCKTSVGRVKEGAMAFGFASATGTKENPCQQTVSVCKYGRMSPEEDLYPACDDISASTCVVGTTMVVKDGPGCTYREAVCVNGQWEYSTFVHCGKLKLDLDPFDDQF